MSKYYAGHSSVMSIEELKDKRNDKNSYKTDFLGLSKVGTSYLFSLQDTAEFYAKEEYARKWNLINLYKRISGRINITDNYLIKTQDQLETMSSDDIMDILTDILCS